MTFERERPPDRLVRARRGRATAGVAVVLLVVGLAVAVVVAAVGAAGSAPQPLTPVAQPTVSFSSGDAPSSTAPESGAPLLVHVLGEVRAPGIVELRPGARILDAVAAAGGVTDAADPAGLNLARRVMDGEQIVVPALGAAPVAAGASGSTPEGGVVSLSTATAEQLESLPRIGPTLAERIVAWREAGGRFTSVDDLLEVDGVGPKLVDAIRDRVVP